MEQRTIYFIKSNLDGTTIRMIEALPSHLKKYAFEFRKGIIYITRGDGKTLNYEEKICLGKSELWDVENDVIWLDREAHIGYNIYDMAMAVHLATNVPYDDVELFIRMNMNVLFFKDLKTAFNILKKSIRVIE